MQLFSKISQIYFKKQSLKDQKVPLWILIFFMSKVYCEDMSKGVTGGNLEELCFNGFRDSFVTHFLRFTIKST